MRTNRGSTSFWLLAALLSSFVAILALFASGAWALANLDVAPLRVLLRPSGRWERDWLEAFFILNGAGTGSLLVAWFAYRRYNRAVGPLLDTHDDPPRDS